MNRFDRYNYSGYTPLSMQEIMMPTMIQMERHDRLDADVGEIESMAAQARYIWETASDGSKLKQDGMALDGSIQNFATGLLEHGVRPDSMREVNRIRGLYNQNIPLMIQAKEASDAEYMSASQYNVAAGFERG